MEDAAAIEILDSEDYDDDLANVDVSGKSFKKSKKSKKKIVNLD